MLDRSQLGLNFGHGGAFPSPVTHSLVQAASYAVVRLLSPRPTQVLELCPAGPVHGAASCAAGDGRRAVRLGALCGCTWDKG